MNSLYYLSEIVLIATRRVLKPITENLVSYESKLKDWSLASLLLTMLSAPFVNIFIMPLSRITTDILFLSDVKGNVSRSSNVFGYPWILICVVAWVLFMN